MQSFASPSPTTIPHPATKIKHHKSNTTNLCPTHTKRAQLSLIPTPFLPKKPQKGRNYRIYPRPFHPKNHRKGATIAHTSRKNCDNLC